MGKRTAKRDRFDNGAGLAFTPRNQTGVRERQTTHGSLGTKFGADEIDHGRANLFLQDESTSDDIDDAGKGSNARNASLG